MPGPPRTPHLVLVGGGLANTLIACRLRQRRPEIAVTVLERGERLGGNHTWSFHETDVAPDALGWLKPFIVHRWPGQMVRFQGRERVFSTPYCSITSDRLHEVASGLLGASARFGVEASRVHPTRVDTACGGHTLGTAVIDGRGAPPRRHLDLGWQKFVGLELRLAQPHGLTLPIIMDATIVQEDGYRFIYVLPLAEDRLLIEDTRYSDTMGFAASDYAEDILVYAANRGWSVTEIVRYEEGALPITLDGDIEGLCRDMGQIARSGLSAALFHPTTGYSLPDAVRLADRLAAEPVLDARTIPQLVASHVRETWRRRGLYRLLNRMLFRAARPERRHQVLAHFYRLPQALVERFYGDRLTLFDKARILTGRPPVPITRAVRAAFGGPRFGQPVAETGAGGLT